MSGGYHKIYTLGYNKCIAGEARHRAMCIHFLREMESRAEATGWTTSIAWQTSITWKRVPEEVNLGAAHREGGYSLSEADQATYAKIVTELTKKFEAEHQKELNNN